ncbi:MAG: trypsin-like peptidase domain-containing protein [Chromatiales bacterium]|nr:trypsin-like peptidase domain-containing protein [Chromatiales bacterium]
MKSGSRLQPILASYRTCWLWLVASVLLQACAASTQIIENKEASEEIRGKSFKAYKEVLLIPPKEDPRKVVPRTVGELEAMGFKVRLIDPEKPIEAAQGTGFVISPNGYLLTCAHVLDSQKQATVIIEGQRLYADVVAMESGRDLALLKLRDPLPQSATALSFRGEERGYSMGEDVYTIGYPLSQILGNSARMSRGLLSSTTGLRDDPTQVQVSAEIQPGNSGGPLLDRDGQVIGVIQKTINPWRVAQQTGGALPQNVNFSMKNASIRTFLASASPDLAATVGTNLPASLEKAGHGVAKILAGLVPEDADRDTKMVVRLNYTSIWDVWFRFSFFALTAYDFDSQEELFAVGQGHDNLVSNEEVVMKDTFNQFRKAIALR